MSLYLKSALILTGALFLSACASSQTMPPRLDQQFGYTPVLAADYEADQQWWKLYNDQELNRLVDLALENNLDLAKSALSVNRALYQAHKLGADLLPTFGASGSAQSGNDLKSGDNTLRTFSAELNVRYELDLWRKLSDAASAQAWEYAATAEDKQAARLALINSVVDAYYQLAYIQGAIAATEENIAHYKQIEQLTHTKYVAGKLDALEPAQARQAWLAAENNVLDLQAQQRETEQTLRNLLNLEPSQPLAVGYPDLLKVNMPGVNLDIPLAVLANRPDLKAAENRLQKAFNTLQATEKSWYPSVSLNAALSSSSGIVGRMFDLPFLMGAIKIDLPFLDWNRIKWDVKISETDFETAKLDFAQSITTALNEVDNYYYQYQKAQEILHKTREKHAYDVEISGYYDVRYRYGANELKDWISALNTEASSRLTLLNNHYTVIRYETAVYKALAGRYSALERDDDGALTKAPAAGQKVAGLP